MDLRQVNEIALLNDQFRKGNPAREQISFSAQVESLPDGEKKRLLKAVREVDFYLDRPLLSFVSAHSTGLVNVGEIEYIWEIDYYDRQSLSSPPNPLDTDSVVRVLTLLRLDEY